jgi:hypothetical protein
MNPASATIIAAALWMPLFEHRPLPVGWMPVVALVVYLAVQFAIPSRTPPNAGSPGPGRPSNPSNPTKEKA